jgi:uncharacterized protein YcbK (DUF882 family)
MTDIFKDKNYKLSENFPLYEFLVSRDHPQIAENMEIKLLQVMTLKFLCLAILQPIRDMLGPIKVLSGFRNDELNSIIGGALNSDHKYGSAADITSSYFNSEVLYKRIKDDIFPYRQLICYPKKNFVHVSINLPQKIEKHEFFIK